MSNPEPDKDIKKLASGFWQDSHGYWFVDETENFMGPYKDEKEVESAAKGYAKYLEGGDLS